MTFKKRIQKAARLKGFTSNQTDDFLALLSNEIFTTLADGETVRLPGVGSLVLVERPEQMKHNPKDGGKVLVPAGKRVKFRKSSALDVLLENA